MAKQYLTTAEAAQALGHKPEWISELVLRGRLDAQKNHRGRWLVTAESVKAYQRIREPVAQCGTTSGNARHRRLGEKPCVACLKAEVDYHRQLRERRRPVRAEP